MKQHYRRQALQAWLLSITFAVIWLASLTSCLLLLHISIWSIPLGIASALAWAAMREFWWKYRANRSRYEW